VKSRGWLRWIVIFAVMGAVLMWRVSGLPQAHAQQTVAQTQPTNGAEGPPPSEATVFKAQSKLVLVDSVITDKKGNYIRDLTKKNFRIWEDDKEQTIKSVSYEAENATSQNPARHYLVLFFDNASLNFFEQARARQAAARFIDANVGPERLIAAVDFGGTLRITQDFTADASRLKKVAAGINTPDFSPTLTTRGEVASLNLPSLASAGTNFSTRSLLVALRDLAKSLAAVPGRKSLVLLSAGFPLPAGLHSELTAAIDACNRANVAVYPIDVRGLVDLGSRPASGARLRSPPLSKSGQLMTAKYYYGSGDRAPRLLFVQHGSKPGPPGPPPGPGHKPPPPPPPRPSQPQVSSHPVIIPAIPSSVTTNQEGLWALADGTGGFLIHDTNDLLGGMDRIAKEQTEYYLLGYTPPDSKEGSCHTLRVKVDRGGMIVRSRSGYCNVKPVDLLAGKPIEVELERHATSRQAGNVSGSLEAPFFFTSPNVARVNLAMEAPSSSIKLKKEKGRLRADVNVLGVAARSDGTEAARFSDTVHLEFGDKELIAFQKKPFAYENQFDIASGQYRLTVVFSSGGESFGKLEIPLNVDYYDGSYFGLSSLALSKEVHPVSEVAEGMDSALMEGHAPLVYRGTEIVPTADYHFDRGTPFTVYLEVYEPLLKSAHLPKINLALRIIDKKTGKATVDLSITDTASSIHEGNPVVPMALKVPSDKLDPGAYQLQLRAMDSAGNVSVARAAEFVVD
jgi:VWFA-related protein